jgi:hypothetical protein
MVEASRPVDDCGFLDRFEKELKTADRRQCQIAIVIRETLGEAEA